jgi:triosephosphate isomerase
VRKPLIAGNWKMNGSLASVLALIEGIKKESSSFSNIDILVLPSFIHLPLVRDILASSSVLYGAQNLYLGAQGAFTGEISGTMLAELGCGMVLVGHSERRHVFNEDLNLIAEKFQSALEFGLTPILCVGETRAEREANQTEKVIREQLTSVIKLAGIDSFKQAVIAYEPVWAIGTGLTATPEQAESVHIFIRELISQNNVDLGNTIRILYGGSMKPENASSLLAKPNIDGGLIGGASLDAESFLAICRAA